MATRKGWEAAKTASDEAKKAAVGSGKYLRLQDDGDSAVVAFLGEPVVKESIWIGDGYEDFDPVKHKGKTPSVRFGICIYNREHGKLQLFEQGSGTLATLLGVYEKYGQFKFWFEVKRKGAKGNKKTVYAILPDAEITPEEKKDLMTLVKEDKLMDVEAEMSQSADESEEEPAQASGSSENEFIGEEDALNIIEKVKMLPREIGKSFMDTLEVGRIREIPASKVKQAKSLLAKIVAEQDAKDGKKDVDPFS